MKRASGGWAAPLWLALVTVVFAATPAGAQDDAPAGNPYNLPETDMSAEPDPFVLGQALSSSGAGAPLAHASNPRFPQAYAVGRATCAGCHSLEELQFSHTVHARAFRSGALALDSDRSCESCHGPGSAHMAAPTEPGSIIDFTRGSATPIGTQTATCLGCHAGGAREHWLGSIHEARGLSCSDCHNPMATMSPEGLLAKRSINDTCASCHQDIRAKFNRRSHMPLPEGQMSCADCHNPHGTVTQPLLKTDSVNTTCYTCHAEKRGPMLFEHPPVRENCLNCHDPHGSNHQTLLVAPMPLLCQQCHTGTRHPNDLQTPIGLGTGAAPDERLMGRSCITCHMNVHGSNNAAGPRFHK